MRRIMSNQEVLEIYKNVIENSHVLANGQKYLEQIIEQVSNFCTLSVSLISDKNIDIKTRNYISSIIKNILFHNWESNHLILQEKNAIRQECLAGVQKSMDDPTIQQNLVIIRLFKEKNNNSTKSKHPYLKKNIQTARKNHGDLISSFMVKDGIEEWKEPFKLLIQLTLNEKTLDFYCLIFSKVDNRINQTVPTLLECLLPVLHLSESVGSSQKCLILYYLAIQSFSFAENVDDDLMRECLDKTYEEYINLFIKILQADEKKFYPNQLIVLKVIANKKLNSLLFINIIRNFHNQTKQYLSLQLSEIGKYNILLKQIFEAIINLNQSMRIPKNNLINKKIIFNALFKDFPNYTENTFKSSLQYLIKYLRKIIEINYELNLRQTPQVSFYLGEQEIKQIEELFEKYLSNDIDIDYENHTQLFVNECLNFVDVVMNYEYAETIYPTLIFPFINVISNLIFIGKHQENLITDDPNLFAASERDNDEEITNIRLKTIKSIERLIENDCCKQVVITSIIQISESMFCNRSEQPLQPIFLELQNTNNLINLAQLLDGFDANSYHEFLYYSSLPKEKELPEWKGKEVALFLLGSFQKQITSFYEQNGGCAFQFIGNLIQEFSAKYLENIQNQMIMCRYYQCFSQFTKQICQHHEHVELIVKSLIYTFSNESSQALRIIALNCLASICSYLKLGVNQFNLFDANNSIMIVQSILQVIKESSEDILPQILTSLVPIFSSISNIANFFTETGIQIIIKLINHFEGKADIQKKVIDFIDVLAKYPQSYAILYRDFEQQILNCFKTLDNFIKSNEDLSKIKQQDINVIQNRIQILKILIRNKQQNEPIFKECQQILLKLLYTNDDISLQQEATLCLKQIIISQPLSLLENKQDLQLLFFKLIDNINTQPEAFSQYLPNLILISYNNNQPFFQFLEINREITQKILIKLTDCQSYFLIITFLVFFTRLIEKNPKETLQFLISFITPDNQSGFEIFYTKLHENFWFINKDIIKNALYIPLAKLLIMEENLLSQFKFGDLQSEAGFQLFCFLSRALEIEVFPEQFDNHQENECLVSHQEFQQYLTEDIYQLQGVNVVSTTKEILTSLFQTMFTNESSKPAFEKYINQMDFDEKIAIENVINQLKNNIN